MKSWILALTVGLTLQCHAISALAVTSWWAEPRILVEADEAVIPAGPIGRAPDVRNATMDTAEPLRVGGTPIDRVISDGDHNWYLLEADDGPGYIRIGATGPINFMSASFAPNIGLQGGLMGSIDGPKEGAALLETSIYSITELAAKRRHKQAYYKISTSSTTPVSYRISFVSELPENRVGSAYGPETAANQYIMAVAYGNERDLYRTTRIRHTAEQALALRQKLFGTKGKLPQNGFSQHRRNRSININAVAELPVQHIILADESSPEDGRHWAFVINCEQRDGLWLVTNAYRNPDLSDKEIAEIIRRDFELMRIPLGSKIPTKFKTTAEPRTAPVPKARCSSEAVINSIK